MQSPESQRAGPRLSVVLPAYNEARRIGRSVDRALAFLREQAYASELIVVSDGSTDATAAVAREAGGDRVRVIDYPRNRGKGYAVRTGSLASSGECILFSDVDFSTPIDEVGRFLDAHAAGADVVIGSRARADSKVRVRQAWWRQSMGRIFNHAVRAAIGTELRDTQCGFKSFRRAAAREIFGRAQIDRYAFDVELLWLAERLGLLVVELPVIWVNDPLSKVHLIRDSLRMLVDLAAIRRNARRGVYERSR